MKVLFITNLPAPYRVDFFNELGKQCELTVLFEDQRTKIRDEKWFSETALYFEAVYLKGICIKGRRVCPEIIKYLSVKKSDIIVEAFYTSLSAGMAIYYMKMKKIPYIISTDGGFIKDDRKLLAWIKKQLIGGAEAWMSPSKLASDYLEFYGADSKKIFGYPFTSLWKEDILNKPFKNEDKKKLKKELGFGDKKIVLSIGQFVRRKGFDVLLKAASRFDKDIVFVIVGGKPTLEYMSIISEYNIDNVVFVEFTIKSELKKYFSAADIFVLPTREDIWGLVINEAMGYGLPVITTEMCNAGLELISNGENGFIVPVDNLDELENKIRFIAEKDQYRETMSENSLKTIQEWTIEKMAEAHYNSFVSILNQRKHH